MHLWRRKSLLSWAKPWLMVDVFFDRALVSLIKIAALADVSMGISFLGVLYLCHAGG
ncbi:paraquat-inducible protein A [Vibrio chagasii]|nr:paraquat-inducible protein A [Vibrio chagasii]